MEKRYFVLKKGYLNINEEFFYFNDHGNWQTCEILKETETPKLTFFYASNYIINIIYTGLVVIFAFLIIQKEISFSFIPLLVLTVIHLLNRKYQLKHFKVPLHKIEHIILRNQDLTVKFASVKNVPITYTVTLDDERETKDIQLFLQEHFQPKLSIA
ncbi:hypothetical protein [uncultured Kordia sp.]|uniref:hypothetical protein n=1 Tax=uncultured Kordia sp. TaxID=507699 RepID=UPI0026331C14|nr:hypothetical protein [uncultured Kordia sp.]